MLPVSLLFTLACSQVVAPSPPTGQFQGTVVDVSGPRRTPQNRPIENRQDKDIYNPR